MKIVLDAFGGDNSPNAVIDGAFLALKKYKDLEIVITGDEEKIKEYALSKKYDMNKIQIVDAKDVITCEDVPTEAIKNKKESSLVKAFDILKNDDACNALISTGSTGAILTGGFLKIGRIKGVSRPAIATFLPTEIKDKKVLLLDCGANADCKSITLCHFALMGSIYYQEVIGEASPKVALLNIGTEDTKGNEQTKKAFKALGKLPINFVGNMEARDVLSGKYDVIVCDGFNGNVLLKSIEGSIGFALKNVKKAFMANLFTKISALFLKPQIKKMKSVLDYKKYGGSPFIGCKKTVIKSHGSSNEISILASIEQAYNMEKYKINEKIGETMTNVVIEVEDD